MKKSLPLLASLVFLAALGALSMQSCAGGETVTDGTGGDNGGNGTGGTTPTGSGGRVATGSGGATGPGSGGRVTTGSGGRATGSGGSTGSGGRVTTGSGGSTNPGSGGSTNPGSGGSSTSGACSGEHPGAMNGYVMGTLMGYAYTFGVVTPMCPSPCFMTSGKQLCAMGTIPADPTFASVGGWGMNVNQAMTGTDPPAMTVTPTGTGINVTAPGATAAMRVQLSNGMTQWCAQLTGANGGMIPWMSFKRECWAGGANEQYTMQPFTKVEIVVPSQSAATTTYCFCVTNVATY